MSSKYQNTKNDDYDTLFIELKKKFSLVEMKMQGCVAVFVAI